MTLRVSTLPFAGEPMNETLKTIFNRKSVRRYRADPIPKEKLELIVKAGMAAPTAVDKRPWEFVVITDKALLKKLGDALPYAKMAEKAGAAILVAGDLDRQFGGREADYWIVDCAAAAENILLAVESLGLGAVWTAVYPEKERIEAVRRLLNVPSSIVPLAFIPIGAPGGDQKPKDKWNPQQLHWNEW
jgi:nitroreductase